MWPGSNTGTLGRSPPKQKERHVRDKKGRHKCTKQLSQGQLGSHLHMEGTSQLVAALGLHGFNLCVMESVKRQVLHLTVILIPNRK